MTAFLIANMAPIMFAALIVFLLLGYPVAFALAANGIFFGLLSLALSMILYGLLVKNEALGSTDGFNILPSTLFGIRPGPEWVRYTVMASAAAVSSRAKRCVISGSARTAPEASSASAARVSRGPAE